MANKKIIEIDVQDDAFKRFMEHFEKFQEQVTELPAEWKKVDEAMGGAGKAFSRSSGDSGLLLAGMAANAASVVDAIKEATKAERHREQAIRRSHAAMKTLGNATSTVSASVLGISKTLLKLGGVGAAVGGVGTIFGLDALASGAMYRQRYALGAGMTPGQSAALSTYFGQFGNADAVAGNIANARNDVSKRWAFAGLGISQRDLATQSNFELELQAYRKAQAMVKSMPEGSWSSIAQARGLTQLFDMNQLRVLRSSPAGNVSAAIEGARRDQGALGFTPEVAKQWTDFSVALRRAGVEIESSFIKGLHRLAPEFATISRETSDWISAFMTGPNMKNLMDTVGNGLHDFADYVSSPTFKKNVHDFGAAIGQLSEEVLGAMKYFGLIPVTTSDISAVDQAQHNPTTTNDFYASMAKHRSTLPAFDAKAPSINAALKAASEKYGVPLDLLQRQAMAESAWNPRAISIFKGKDGKDDHAYGLMQLRKGTADDLGVQYPMNYQESAMGGAKYDQMLLKRYHGDQEKAIAAYNWGMRNVDRAIKRWGADWLKHAPAETRGYLNQIVGAGKAHTDARIAAKLGTSDHVARQARQITGTAQKSPYQTLAPTPRPSDPLAHHLEKVLKSLKPKGAQKASITINNNTASNLAIQANAAGH